MNISQAAEASGLPVKTLRYYEALGLVVPERQEGNDYRDYTPENVRHLRFLQRSRAAGFSLAECQRLLAVYLNGAGEDPSCQQWLKDCVSNLDARMLALDAMRQTLADMLADPAGKPADLNQQSGMSFLLVTPRE